MQLDYALAATKLACVNVVGCTGEYGLNRRQDLKRWQWEEVDTARSGASGDVSKLFKNEIVAEPGILAANAPHPDASLLAREVLQNSWDAARELQGQSTLASGDSIEFRISFHFEEISGTEKMRFISSLGLKELASKSRNLNRSSLGLQDSDCLVNLDGPEPIRILRIEEAGTTGMYGPFVGTQSKMYLALVSVGFTVKNLGDGGSYGYGKAGLIRGSKIRTLIAYSCFQERQDDPGVTRRLLGMTYWGPHQLTESFTGFGRFGVATPNGTFPFENKDADMKAKSLRINPRSHEFSDQLGTTFLLLDPEISASDLCIAIERNWWPALVDNEFSVEITDFNGDRLIPKPKRDATLRPFIRAYELATTAQDNQVTHEHRLRFNAFKTTSGRSVDVGTLGLVADVDGFSFPREAEAGQQDPDSQTVDSERSLVALVRGPKMVVEYFDAGRSIPFVRGTFVADPDADDLLRQIEPRSHNSWRTSLGTEGVEPEAPEVAKVILGRIVSQVNGFRRSITPSTTTGHDFRLPELERFFRTVFRGSVNPAHFGQRVEDDPVRIHISDLRVEPDRSDSEMIRTSAAAACALSRDISGLDSHMVQITFKFVFLEEDRAGRSCALRVRPPKGFQLIPGPETTFRGELSSEPVRFRITSDSYSSDWTARLQVSGRLATVAESDGIATSVIRNLDNG